MAPYARKKRRRSIAKTSNPSTKQLRRSPLNILAPGSKNAIGENSSEMSGEIILFLLKYADALRTESSKTPFSLVEDSTAEALLGDLKRTCFWDQRLFSGAHYATGPGWYCDRLFSSCSPDGKILFSLATGICR